MATNSCTCLDSPNMLAGPCQACGVTIDTNGCYPNNLASAQPGVFETGETVQVSNCTFVGGSTDDDVVVKFNSSPFEYCLPGSVIRHIPPAQCECGKQYAKIDGVTYCPDCTTAMTGLTESELRQALADPVEAKVPWKPVAGEKVLVEAVVCKIKPARDGYADVEILDHYYYADTGEASDLEDPNRIRIPLSQLRPLPVVQGENLE